MNILFLCTGNSARSQIAEGLAKSIFGSKASIESAGSQPKSLNPLAVEAMKEIGIDISRNYSKSYDKLPLKFIVKTDFIISLCAEENCPDMASRTAKKITWPIVDPAASNDIQDFRNAIILIKELLEVFAKENGLLD